MKKASKKDYALKNHPKTILEFWKNRSLKLKKKQNKKQKNFRKLVKNFARIPGLKFSYRIFD